ncbi:mannose-6-phosphate isomerase [Neorhizobium galegae]|uniref:AGE family epimerase/isomerase n=1 Tax=Neorhizobium galegae TaxID=399 RepID=UPI001AE98CDC|nr:AGE family epimerase/isomerase [Neorhizobium galegae]MBP2551187.1 mannose-6-phosphate isomerase [Neorhizobium galegae]
MLEELTQAQDKLEHWLHAEALPLWRAKGFQGEAGGFVETIDLSGLATSVPRRSRVQPRQVYCFAEAGCRGWDGDWQTPTEQGLKFFDRVYLLENGFYGALATAEGEMTDDSFDLYNQAFAILSFVYTAKAFPDTTTAMAQRASQMLARLKAGYAHAEAGFEEAVPRRLPLCSNPHMHLFEASLACEAQAGFDEAAWRALSDEIAGLCMRRFIDATSGGLREFFNGEWAPFEGAKGRIMEPGHQFEWAWLLARWAERRGDTGALAKARRLFEIGEQYGICATRKVAIMALNDDFSVADPLARLWPQTEWIKSAAKLAVLSSGAERERYLASVLAACAALDVFLKVPLPGLWRDKLSADGQFVEEPAPASSFYHILCAIYELRDCFQTLSEQTSKAA